MQFDSLLVEKYRPKSLKDIALSDENRKLFENIKTEIPNYLLAGPAGTGKTSLAKIVVNDILGCQYLYINASSERSIDDIRNLVTTFAQTKSIDGKMKVIILDECDGITLFAQQALKNVMEEYAENARYILTCNNVRKIIDPIRSRCQEVALSITMDQFITKSISVIRAEKITLADPAQKLRLLNFLKARYPDLRRAINAIQKHTIDYKLTLPDTDEVVDFSKDVFDFLQAPEKNILELRKTIIENEQEFGNDYRSLLVGLFNQYYDSGLSLEAKRSALLIISEYLYRNNLVADVEINTFACLLELGKA